MNVAARQASKFPLVVDLDGTLLKTDTLFESLAGMLAKEPLAVLGLLWTGIVKGRSGIKRRLAQRITLDIESLPVREDLLDWLQSEAAQGRSIHLCSAADELVVAQIAERFAIFESFAGSNGVENLKGPNKARYLAGRFPDGFAYAGDSRSDVPVWNDAKGAVLAGRASSISRIRRQTEEKIEASFPDKGRLRALFRQLRPHQWSKNILVFIPLLLAHRYGDTQAWLHLFVAFAGLCAVASGTYILNDLLDLGADRTHISKRLRPLASGTVPIGLAFALVPVLIGGGLALALAASWLAAVTLLAYLALTLSYSFWLKRIPLFDTAVLGLLFALRILLGCTAIFLDPSFWMLAFSITFFFSLSTAKRQTEIMKKEASGDGSRQQIGGRGYQTSDAPLTLAYGVSTGIASLVILILYTTNDVAPQHYHNPDWLWAIPLLLYFWLMRIWLFAHHGRLNDDPIVFALKDRVSLAIGFFCIVAFYLAL